MAQRGLSAEESGFQPLWAGTDLGEFRPSRGTYELYPYESLPQLPEDRFTSSFDWLGEPGEPVAELAARTDQISAALAEAGLALPEEFVTLTTRTNFHKALDQVSCTACWSYLAGPFASPTDPAARLVMFYRDQQDCVLWYLYLRPAADGSGTDGSGTESFVVCSFRQFEEEEESQAAPETAERVAPENSGIFWCAPSIEQFAYRSWIEGKLWFYLSGDSADDALTADMESYLAPYKHVQAQAQAVQ